MWDGVLLDFVTNFWSIKAKHHSIQVLLECVCLHCFEITNKYMPYYFFGLLLLHHPVAWGPHQAPRLPIWTPEHHQVQEMWEKIWILRVFFLTISSQGPWTQPPKQQGLKQFYQAMTSCIIWDLTAVVSWYLTMGMSIRSQNQWHPWKAGAKISWLPHLAGSGMGGRDWSHLRRQSIQEIHSI